MGVFIELQYGCLSNETRIQINYSINRNIRCMVSLLWVISYIHYWPPTVPHIIGIHCQSMLLSHATHPEITLSICNCQRTQGIVLVDLPFANGWAGWGETGK